jgi:NAD(P)-dependent dehydrogenase (short-subunit alcohol dehydrogenase family)
MKRVLVTGATRGLGLEIARALAARGGVKVILAVRDLARGREIAKSLGPSVSAAELNLSSLAGVASFARNWGERLDALVNNAGVQNGPEERFTPDGYEETIAVNFLAPLLLTLALSESLRGGRVLFIGSGTQDPAHPVARRFGFRGARYSSVRELAAGARQGEGIAQASLDRYATSKFLISATAVELARRRKDFSSFVLDPGLMPGTGLARSRGVLGRFLWKRALPIAGAFMPDTSSARRSAEAARWMLTEEDLAFPSGSVLSFDRKPATYVWRRMVDDERVRGEIFEDSLGILDAYR